MLMRYFSARDGLFIYFFVYIFNSEKVHRFLEMKVNTKGKKFMCLLIFSGYSLFQIKEIIIIGFNLTLVKFYTKGTLNQ